jgi:hypothetical protein
MEYPMTETPNTAWKQYEGDFNAMTDEEVEQETNRCLNELAELEDWLEAVASWKQAGKPRSSKQ